MLLLKMFGKTVSQVWIAYLPKVSAGNTLNLSRRGKATQAIRDRILSDMIVDYVIYCTYARLGDGGMTRR